MSERTGARRLLRAAVPKPLRRVLHRVDAVARETSQRRFERRLGVSTGGHVYFDEESLTATRVFYEPVEWLPLTRVLRSLRPDGADVFVDLGSGKGQALLVAARFPYQRVRGVEIMPELAAVANANAQRARPQLRCADVHTECADVLDWDVPDDMTTLFMYCPFTGEIFHEVMAKVFASFDRRQRPLFIVYVYPWEHNWLINSGRVVVEGLWPAQWPAKPWWWRTGWVITVYRVVAEGEGKPGPLSLRRKLFRPKRALQRWGGSNDQHYKIRRGDQAATSAD